jgi:lysophospholipase L1-like esterase
MRAQFIALAFLTTQVAAADTAARIVAAGDSVMWGQGLNHADKFPVQIAAQYEQLAGRKATLEMRAHSGATLATRENDVLKTLADADSEVPRHDKSITTQVKEVANPETVDLLIVNGCINDISPTNLVLRNLKDAQPSYWKAEAQAKCLGPMTTLLGEALKRFPKANIVVTGYYPLFTKAAPPAKGPLGKLKHFADKVGAAAKLPDAVVKNAIDWACGSNNVKCIAGLLLNKGELSDGLTLKSQWWVEESDKALGKAVDDANAAVGSHRVAFAPVAFAPGEGIGQAKSKLWNFGEVDAKFQHRAAACKRASDKEPKLDPKECSVASVFHPNLAGSKLYASAVAAAIGTFDNKTSCGAAGAESSAPLKLFWSDKRKDNFITANAQAFSDAIAAGYNLVRTEGRLLTTKCPGTIPLKNYWHKERGDNMATATGAGEGAAKGAGYSFVRVEGFVYQKQAPKTIPLKLYWNENRGDNMTVSSAEAEGAAKDAGYKFVRVEGYVLPP